MRAISDKKAQNITVTTIIIIVLALIVLVVLVLGFTGSWSQLWERITGVFGGPNVASVVQACQVSCTTESTYDYCTRMRTVRFDDKAKDGKYNCKSLETEQVGLDACGMSNCEPSKILKSEEESKKSKAQSNPDEEREGSTEQSNSDTATG